ncbi:hypothetical protein IFM89_017340 [Coptis chinensis]|uniref:Voltage-gated hydrogen channel 1 n=1 Tax=Coptis chinensis TaxID=261450 RepID=A0A835H5U2_9MAGN|nr:hypothetical protein IFM89_017340 [Coptis chinensis]
MNSFQTQEPQPPSSLSIEITESSVQKLLRKWQRRERWHRCFNIDDQQNDHHKRAPWRIQLANFLESTPLHVLALLLLLLDLLFTVLDLSSSLLSCSSKKNEKEGMLYHWGGIAILSVLTTKMLALVVALGKTFFKRPGRVVDGVVVSGALVLESLLETKGAGLVVVVSLWRVVRIIESAFELSDEAIEAQIEGVVCQFEALRNENQQLQDIIVEKDKIIAELEEILHQAGKYVNIA